MLAVVHWDGGGDGQSWLDAANWSENRLPNSADDVVIDVADQDVEVFVYGEVPAVQTVTNNETLVVLGTPQLGTGKLSTGSLVNQNTLQLESTTNSASAVIDTLSGSVINAAGAKLEVLSHSGGSREIIGSLINDGDVIFAGERALRISGESAKFEQRGGRVTNSVESGQGTIDLTGGEFVWTGGTFSESALLFNSSIDISAGVEQETEMRVWGNSTLVNNLAENVTLHVEGTYGYGHAVLTSVADAQNRGTIRLASGHHARLSTIDVTAGLHNTGTIQIDNASQSIGYVRGSLRNAGDLIVAPEARGDFVGTYIGDGGSITGDFYLASSTVRYDQAPSETSRLRLYGDNHLASDIPDGVELEVTGSYAWGHARLVLDQDVANHGQIEITSVHHARQSTVDTGANTLTNAVDGKLLVLVGGGNARYLEGSIVNQGSVSVEGGQTLWMTGDHASLDMQNGRYDGGGSIVVQSGPLTWSGGDVDSDLVAFGGTINVIESVSDRAVIRSWGTTTLANNLGSNVTLHAQGTYGYGHAVLTSAADAENRGTIRLASGHHARSTTLDVAAGLHNTGVIQIDRASQSTGYVRGTLRNSGALIVGDSAAGDFIGSYIGDGGTVSGDFYLASSTIQFAQPPRADSRLRLYGTNHLSSDVPHGAILQATGSYGWGHGQLILDQNVVNHGQIEITSVHHARSSTVDTLEHVLTNSDDGELRVLVGSGNGRRLNGALVNQGDVFIETGQSLWVTGDYASLDFQSGQYQGGGSLIVQSGPLTWSGGDVDSDLVAYGGSLTTTSDVSDDAVVRTWGTTTLVNHQAENVTLHVQATYSYGHAVLQSIADAENHGTIQLASGHHARSSTLDVAAGLHNIGSVRIDRASQDIGYIRGALRNSGDVDVALGARGDFVGSYTGDGGRVGGNFYLASSIIQYAQSPSDESRLLLYGENHLASDVPTNVVLQVTGSHGWGHGELVLDRNVVNHGQIEITSVHHARSSTVNAGDFVLTNASDGLVTTSIGSGNSRNLLGNLANAGRLLVRQPLTLGDSGAAISNTGIIGAWASVYVAADSFTNHVGALVGGIFDTNATQLVDNGTIDRDPPAAVDATIDSAIIQLVFNAPLNADSVTQLSSYRLNTPGADNVLGTADDVDVSDHLVSATVSQDQQTAWIIIDPPIDSPTARLVVDATSMMTDESTALFDSQIVIDRPTEVLPAVLDVMLDVDQDTGVSDSDGLTRISTPVFTYSVNKPGQIAIDFDGDGLVDFSGPVSSPGTFSVQSFQLPDDVYRVHASFTDGISNADDALWIEIDSQSPTLEQGTPTLTAPVYERMFGFSEPIDDSGLLLENLSLQGPDGLVDMNDLTETSDGYRIGTEALITPGDYELVLPNQLTDLAGNPVLGTDGERVVDAFEILPDTRAPKISDLRPAGIRNLEVSTIEVQFDEEILIDSFDASDLTITLPDGSTADVDGYVVTAISSREFSVATQGLSGSGVYQIQIGPDVTDLSGNPMERPGYGVFTIDREGPRVTAIDISVNVDAPLTQFELITSEPVLRGSLQNAISITHPDGTLVSGLSVLDLTDNRNLVQFPALEVSGTYSVTVAETVVDRLGNAIDQDGNGIGGEQSDRFSTEFTIRLPDLGFDQQLASDSDQVALGETVNLQWASINSGALDATGQWTDQVLLSSDAIPSADDLVLLTLDNTDQGIGIARPRDADVVIPIDRSLIPGTYHLLVTLNADSSLVESSAVSNVSSLELGLELPPLPDLVPRMVQITGDDVGPNDTFAVSWTTVNDGQQSASDAWVERVYVSPTAAGNDPQLVGELAVSDPIPAANAAERSLEIVAPASGLVGDLYVFIEVDAADEIFEKDEFNQVAFSDGSVSIRPALSASVGLTQVREDHGPLTIQLTRNGPTTQSLVVDVDVDPDPESQFVLPDQITIPVGVSTVNVEAVPVANDGVDDDAVVNVTFLATGMDSAAVSVLVTDIDRAELTLGDTGMLSEGEVRSITLSRNDGLQTEQFIKLIAEPADQIELPEQVVFAAGESEIRFDVMLYDDPILEAAGTIQLVASAVGYIGDSIQIESVASDLPNIDLFMPISFSEDQPLQYVSVSRAQITNRPLTLQFRTDAPNQITFPRYATIPAGEDSIIFPVQVIDDDLTEDESTVSIFVDAIDPRSGVVVDQMIASGSTTLLDNDQPALSIILDRTVVSETGSIQGLVRRNEMTDQALVVNLASLDTDEATVPQTVTIAAGMRTAAFDISGQADQIVDGEQSVTLTAASDGWLAGSGQVVVSDSDLPDLVAVVGELPLTAQTKETLTASYELRNQGVAPADAGRQRVLLRNEQTGDEIFVAEFSVNESIDPGHAIRRDFPLDLPEQVGNYRLVVRVDVLSQVQEILESNNLAESSETIQIEAAYQVSVSSDVEVAQAGTAITLSGTATDYQTGSPAALETVHVNVHHGSTRRLLTALTDANGQFTTTFVPLQGEAGNYQVSASHPGAYDQQVQDDFTLIGLELSSSRITIQESSESTGTIRIKNLADLPVSNLSIEVLDHPDNVTVTTSLDSTSVSGSTSTGAQLTVHADDATYIAGFVHVRVSSDDAPPLETHVPISIVPLQSRLQLDQTRLSGTMCVGHQSVWRVDLTNNGSQVAEDLTVNLPAGAPWMTLLSSLPERLEIGETASFELLLSPPEDLDLTAYRGSVGIEAHDSWTSLPFDFRAVSQATGDLQIRVADEYHYFADEKPLLEGASVRLIDAISGQPVEGFDTMVTPADGTIQFSELVEGYYQLEVWADEHESYRETIRVLPGITNNQLVFISRQAVTYTWTVEEIEIEDRYLINVESLFETNVPMPVVHTDAKFDLSPLQEVGQEMQVLVKVTNDGLVAVNDVALDFGSHPYYEFDPLVDVIDVLPAKTELTIPVIVRRVAAGAGAGGEGESTGNVPCDISVSLVYTYICDEEVNKRVPIAVYNVEGDCSAPPTRPSNHSPIRGGRITGGGSRTSVTPVDVRPGELCDCIPEKYELAFASGPLGALLRRGEKAIKNLIPQVQELSVKSNAKFTLEKCCEGKEDKGWKASGAGNLKLTAEVLFGIGANIDVGEDTIRPGGWSILGFQAAVGLGIKATLTGSVGANFSTDCGMTNLVGCVSANAQLEIFAGAFADGSWTIEKNGKRFVVGGSIEVGLKGGIQGSYKHCSDGKTSSSLCRSDILAVAQGKINLGDVDDENVKGASGSISVGFDWILLEGTCDQPDGGEGESVEDPLDLSTILSVMDMASMLGYGSTNHLNSTLGLNLHDDDLLDAEQATLVLDQQYAFNHASGQGVCAQVALSISQELVLTRQGFDARLEMNNGSSSPLQDFGVDVIVYDGNGNDVSDLFVFRDPDFDGFTQVDGSGELAAGLLGNSNWVLIPLSEAAPELITEYFVGGQIRYTDTGREVTIDLARVPIKVRPQPELDLVYFHQRDVIADDPFTAEIEESEPFSLGVLIKNSGAGEAKNLRIDSAQPRIIENERGLLIDFEIISTLVNGGLAEPTLTADFGDLPAHSNAVAMWQMVSTLQGLFVDYKASFRHLDPSGDPRLSLIKSVEIHEMIRPVRIGNDEHPDDGLPDFLVNDSPDPLDLPDTLYTSDGGVFPVELADDPEISDPPTVDNRYRSTLYASMPAQWGYVRVKHPADQNLPLVAVIRPDGTKLSAENFWTTSRTFVGGGRAPIAEDIVHLLDHSGAGSYTLVFSDGDVTGPQIIDIVAIDPNPTTIAVDSIDVLFDEPVDLNSISSDDFLLYINGTETPLPITFGFNSLTESSIQMTGLGTATGDDAVYQLWVNTSGIEDDFGNFGNDLQQITWVKGEAAPAIKSLHVPGGIDGGSFDSITIEMTEPIVVGQISQSIELFRDGAPVPLPSLTIVQSDTSTYSIRGFDALPNDDGDYELVIDASMVHDLDGIAGLGTRSLDWMIDTAGPVVTSVRAPVNDPRNIAVQQIDVRVNESIDLESFGADDISLYYEDESINLLDGETRLRISDKGQGTYRIYGINWPQARQGDYRFEFHGTGLTDAAGNFGSGTVQTTWTLDLSRPDVPSDLTWHSVDGAQLSDVTVDRSVRLVGSFAEPGLRLAIHDLSTAERLQTLTLIDGTLDWSFDLPHQGINRLELRVIDDAANVTRVDLAEIEWNQKPSVLLTDSANLGMLRSDIDGPVLTFTESVNVDSFDAQQLELWKDGRRIDLNGVTLVPDGAEGETQNGVRYRLSGLSQLLESDADYRLVVSTDGLETTDGRPAAGQSEFHWQVDGDTPAMMTSERFSQGGSSRDGHWAFAFSEPIRLDDLIADRTLPFIWQLHAMGEDARIGIGTVSELTAEDYQYVNSDEQPSRLIVDTSQLADGVYRWDVSSELIVDSAGNELDATAPVVFHRLLGDVNDDTTVDFNDHALVQSLLGTTETDANWDPRGDVNGDGHVSQQDLDSISSRLGRRVLYPGTQISADQNPLLPYDTNIDGHVTPLDALRVINFLGRAVAEPELAPPAESYLDVNGNHDVSPLDALQVINFLGRTIGLPTSGAEGESIESATSQDIDQISAVPSDFVPAATGTRLSLDEMHQHNSTSTIEHLDSSHLNDFESNRTHRQTIDQILTNRQPISQALHPIEELDLENEIELLAGDANAHELRTTKNLNVGHFVPN